LNKIITQRKIEELKKTIKELSSLRMPKCKSVKFAVSDLMESDNILEKIKNKPEKVLYWFELEVNENSRQILHGLINDYWEKNKKDVHLSNINKHKSNNVLYVGSSRKNFKRRMKEHLGTDNQRTYAMHLKDWLFELPDVNISIKYYVFGNKISGEILQIIEDAYWEFYKPILGKKGSA